MRIAVKSIPFADYMRLSGVSWSALAKLETSALKFHDELLEPSPPTPTMELGTAMHTAILEPDSFGERFLLWTESRATNDFAGVAAGAEAAGISILSAAEWEQCMGAACAVHHAPHGRAARRVMRGCKRELSLQWTDAATGIRCKARPDLVGVRRGKRGVYRVDVISDLKTTATVDARKFGRVACDLLYHGKMAFAARGIAACFGAAPASISLIAVEQKRPHDVAVFELDPDVLLAGDELVAKLLRRLKTCRRRGTWPGRYPEAVPLDFPSWALPSDTDLTDLGFAFEVREARDIP